MRVRGPHCHYPTGRKIGVSHIGKCSDETGYKQSNKKYFHWKTFSHEQLTSCKANVPRIHAQLGDC